MPVLQASGEAIRDLLRKALPAPSGAVVVPFPLFARAIHAFEDYQVKFAATNIAEEAIEGVGLAGPDRWVRSLTGSLKLLR